MSRNRTYVLALMVSCLTIALHLRSQHLFESQLNAIVDAHEAESLSDLPEGMNRARNSIGLPAIQPKNLYDYFNAQLEYKYKLYMSIDVYTNR